MKPIPSLVPRSQLIWWTCGAAFVIGLALGSRKIHSKNELLPAPQSIRELKRDELKLDHPLSRDPRRANPPGKLRIWLFSGRALAGPPLAVVEEPPILGTYSPWLNALINEKLNHSSDNFSLKMRGWITFSSPRTIMHLRSDDGYRIRFRNALGEERSIVHWVEDVTEDLPFGALVEPGRYEIEIEYFNAGGNFFFELWGTPQVEFEPAPDPQRDSR